MEDDCIKEIFDKVIKVFEGIWEIDLNGVILMLGLIDVYVYVKVIMFNLGCL